MAYTKKVIFKYGLFGEKYGDKTLSDEKKLAAAY